MTATDLYALTKTLPEGVLPSWLVYYAATEEWSFDEWCDPLTPEAVTLIVEASVTRWLCGVCRNVNRIDRSDGSTVIICNGETYGSAESPIHALIAAAIAVSGEKKGPA